MSSAHNVDMDFETIHASKHHFKSKVARMNHFVKSSGRTGLEGSQRAVFEPPWELPR